VSAKKLSFKIKGSIILLINRFEEIGSGIAKVETCFPWNLTENALRKFLEAWTK
jgi:hypothetical protein